MSDRSGKVNVRRDADSIYFFDKITDESSLEFHILLNGIESDTVTIKINTSGGDVSSAFSIYNIIREISKLKEIITINEGRCHSAGTIILSAGTIKLARQYSTYLIHDFRRKLSGKHEDIRDEVYNGDILLKFYKEILCNQKFSHRTLTNLIKNERYLTPKECLSYGLIDHIC